MHIMLHNIIQWYLHTICMNWIMNEKNFVHHVVRGGMVIEQRILVGKKRRINSVYAILTLNHSLNILIVDLFRNFAE